MAWITPKTDWKDGDTFNLNPDYQRIRGDILEIQQLAQLFYEQPVITPMQEYSITDFPRSDFLNTIVENVESLKSFTFVPLGWQEMRTYEANAPGWEAEDLNKIEGNLGQLKAGIQGQENLLPMLEFALGGSEF